jgi:hypothetical protein
MWEISPESKITALAALCLTLVDEELVEDVWVHCQSRLLAAKPILNVDTVLAVNILLSRRRIWTKREYLLDRAANQAERANYILLDAHSGAVKQFRSRLGNCFALVGVSRGASHTTAFRKNIEVISNQIVPFTLVEHVRQTGQRLADILDDFEVGTLYVDSSHDFSASASNIRKAVDRFGAAGEPSLPAQVREGAYALHDAVFGDHEKSLLRGLGREFLREVKARELRSAFLDDEKRDILRRWTDIVTQKQRQSVWSEPGSGRITQPSFLCATDSPWGQDAPLYYDRLVRQAVQDTLANVVHTRSRLSNPWGQANSRMAHMWWRIDIKDHYLVLETANATGSKLIQLRPSLGIAGLERIGGCIVTEPLEGKNAIVTRLCIPLPTTFIGES